MTLAIQMPRCFSEIRIQGKRRVGKHDLFVCYPNDGKECVIEISEALWDLGIRVWLDEWELVPGRPWQEQLEQVKLNNAEVEVEEDNKKRVRESLDLAIDRLNRVNKLSDVIGKLKPLIVTTASWCGTHYDKLATWLS